ncbi:MAG: DUF6089 family protein, partial [Saprospiraceae bacterium]
MNSFRYNMMVNKFKYLILLGILCLAGISHGQKGYELGGWLGTSFYFGDLNTNLKITKPSLAGGLNARYNFNTRIAAKTSLNYGRIAADDANSDNNFERNRNLSFQSHIFDWSNVIEFNFFKYEHGHKEFYMTPYFFGGFNVFHFNPTAELDGEKYSLRNFGTEGQPLGQEYSPFNLGLILGGGFKYDINRTWSVNLEISTRFVFTDYLDDVSSIFPDKTLLESTRG